MEKETSCINSRAILDYLKAHEIDYAEMIKNLDPEIDDLEDPEGFLRNPDNWIPTGVVSKLFERATRLLDDEETAYKMGRYATENTNLGFAQRIIVKAFWSFKRGLRHCQKINDQWNRSKKVELVNLRRNAATVRLHWDPGMETSKYICQYNQGVYTYLPLIWGANRLALEEKCCYFDGAPYCEYHLSWPLRNRFHEIISRFFASKSVLVDTIEQMEKDKNIINQKNDELRSINSELEKTIVEQRQTEEALRQVKERTESILQNIQSGVCIIDAGTHRIIDVNPAAEAMIGGKRKEIIGHVCHQFMCPAAQGECPITDRGQRADNTETVLLRKDGEQREILKTVISITMDGRECLLESFVDITERKQSARDVLAHQERFKIFFSSVNDAIFVHPLCKEGFAPFIEVNDIACQRYGYSREEFLKLTASDITLKSDAKTHAAPNHRGKLLERKHLIFESIHIKKSGETFPVEINSNIVEQYGKPVILAVVRDTSERKGAEEEKARIEAQYRQAQKVEAIGRLAGGVAHDLNNLLSPIIGYGELLMCDFSPDDKRRESVNQIVRAGYGARDLVRQLLAFSRKQTLEYKPLNLNEAIKGFEKLLRRTIREDIELEIILSSLIRTAKADIGQIEQVIMNLSVNAQDAMPGGGKLTIETAMAAPDVNHEGGLTDMQPDQYVMLTVSDNGCGIDEETLEHIFEPFFSTKGEQGTGLGLATVYGIVKQHGGNIRVYSKPGKGTSFKVYLPVSEGIPVEIKTGKRTATEMKGSETILLVEDNEQVRNLGHAILKRQGYMLLVAESGADALTILASHDGPVDLLLTDVVMPDMNGKDLFTEVAEKYPGIKVLYMSGYTDNVIAHHGVLEEGVQFIQKPFAVNGLATRVREVLEQD